MADYRTILYEKMRKGVLITLNRPEQLNAISDELHHELHAALKEAEQDPEVRAIVLTGAGRAFSAGFDLQGGGEDFVWPYGIPEGQSVAQVLDEWFQRAWGIEHGGIMRLWELSKPVIAAVHGWCMGGGSWYALTSHMTYAADDAVFGQVEVRMTSDDSFMWVQNAGYKDALRYALVGDHIDAQEAYRIGLVNKVVPKDQLLEECFKLVERIALVSPETVKINLAVATEGLEVQGLRNTVFLNAVLAALVLTSQREEFRRPLEEARKKGGLRAFIQARDAPFQPEPFGPRSRPRPQQ